MDRLSFADRLDSCESYPEIVSELEGMSVDQLSVALPSLPTLTQRLDDPLLIQRIHALLLRVLIDPSSTRSSRKAVVECLHIAPLSSSSDIMCMLLEAFEEPQMHIVLPFLPLFNQLLDAVYNQQLSFEWGTVSLVRALQHTNGWIRLWGVEMFLTIRIDVIRDNYEFFLDTIIPSLSAGDLLWRFFAKEKLTLFLEQLAVIVAECTQADGFARSLLSRLGSLKCPLAVFFLATSLPPSPQRVLPTSEVEVMRMAVSRVLRMSQFPLRRRSFTHVVSFVSECVLCDDLPSYLRVIASLLRMFDEYESSLSQIISVLPQHLDRSQYVNAWKEIPLGKDTVEEYSLLLCMMGANESSSLWSSVSSLESKASFLIAYSMAFPNEHHKMTTEFLATLDVHDVNLDNVDFICRLIRTCSGLVFPQTLLARLESTESFEEECVLYRLIDSFFFHSSSPPPVVHLFRDISTYSSLRNRSPSERRKQSILFYEEASSAKLHLLLGVLDDLDIDHSALLTSICTDVYDASTYLRKEQLILLIKSLIPKVKEEEIVADVIEVAQDIASEEKKSCNYLPALRNLLSICTSERMLDTEKAVDVLLSLLDASSLNESIAALVGESLRLALEKADVLIDNNVIRLCELSVSLFVFGPIPKRETLVLHEALSIAEQKGEPDVRGVRDACHTARMTGIACVTALVARGHIRHIVDHIVATVHRMDSSSSKSFGLSMAHRQKTRCVSLLLLIVDSVPEDLITLLWDLCVNWLVDPSQQFSIKLIVEWILVRLCLLHRNTMKKLFELGKEMASRRVGSVSSWVNVMVLLARVSAEIVDDVLSSLLPWTTAQNFSVRCTAIAGVRLLLEGASSHIRPIAEGIAYFADEPAGNAQRVIGNLCDDFYFAHLNASSDLCLESVLNVIPSKTGLPVDEVVAVSLIQSFPLPIPTLCTNQLFVTGPSLVYSNLEKNSNIPSMDAIDTIDAEANSFSAQKKMVTKERENGDASLILVSSFIDKAANLGGLCRTCEVFSVSCLVVADPNVISDPSFVALSMSAEKWQNIQQVRPDKLLAYLEAKKAEGYTVVAAEQANDSVPLHTFNFPQKTVLVMGDERKGVPMSILRTVHSIVHIEQLGRVRSLNVHVTAAIFINRYAEQHLILR